MRNPTECLKTIIDTAIDLYRSVMTDEKKVIPEELVKMGKLIKQETKGLVDMAWYKADATDWNDKHPGNIGTKL